jgi:hypothetical protein
MICARWPVRQYRFLALIIHYATPLQQDPPIFWLQSPPAKEPDMKTSIPARPHGVGLRGGSLSRNSPLFEGPFGRIFRALPPADFGDTDQQSQDALNALALSMIADPDDPKDGADPEESGIPSIYTYFGQFIDHDLTFDPASSLQKQNDPDALEDYRTPRFDLDNVYGRGPDDQPYFYADGRTFLQGKPLSGAAANPNARDLPRSWDRCSRGTVRSGLTSSPRLLRKRSFSRRRKETPR